MEEKKLKILVVEDNRAAQMAIKMVLINLGYAVDIASSGAEAIQLTLNQEYDLIFMDIGLGDTDGYQVTREIRQQASKNNNKPIIALTAHSADTVTGPALESGMNKIMTKPLFP